MERRIEVPAEWEGITRLMAFADTVEQELPLSADQHYLVRLVIEEIATNIVKYGYEEQHPGVIRARCACNDGVLHVTISDHGRPFDPRDPPDPDFGDDVETRSVGGLGIFLVRELCDDIDYQHNPMSGWNELTVTKAERKTDV
jgi:anti-sigma regulatory factor (Ser/Thr protein kinase)